MTQNETEYLRLSDMLDKLIEAGADETPEGDSLRDLMESQWMRMPYDRQRLYTPASFLEKEVLND